MEASEEELNQECVERMKLLKLDEQIINEFAETGYIYISEINETPQKADVELMEILKRYGEKRDIKVYYIQVSNKFDNMYNWDFYYISKYKDEWKSERENATNNNFEKIHYNWKIEDKK